MVKNLLVGVAWVLYGVSLVAYVVSFFLPAAYFLSIPYYGYQAFLTVASALFNATLSPSERCSLCAVWLANPTFWAGAVLFGLRKPAGATGAALLAVACGVWALWVLKSDLNEAGFVVWFGSLGLLCLATFVDRMARAAHALEKAIQRFRAQVELEGGRTWRERNVIVVSKGDEGITRHLARRAGNEIRIEELPRQR